MRADRENNVDQEELVSYKILPHKVRVSALMSI